MLKLLVKVIESWRWMTLAILKQTCNCMHIYFFSYHWQTSKCGLLIQIEVDGWSDRLGKVGQLLVWFLWSFFFFRIILSGWSLTPQVLEMGLGAGFLRWVYVPFGDESWIRWLLLRVFVVEIMVTDSWTKSLLPFVGRPAKRLCLLDAMSGFFFFFSPLFFFINFK